MPRRPGQRDSTLETRGKLVTLWNEGVSKREIVERIRQVERWIRREQEGAENNRPLITLSRSSRRPILNDGDKENIIEQAANLPFTITTIIRDALQLNCSIYTVRRIINAGGLRCRRPARKPELTQDQANSRLQFAYDNLNRDWSRVIFTDEKTFCTSTDGKKVLWRSANTRYLPQNIQSSRRSGRISVGYWG
ncbi:hypothetical protein ILUMI_17401 [Ignelater luminosus]|uniref:Transposase Tc1-like domain-containing protein n=1 Tax=Ignelater luminosus TaxID=2038154 RepID=A0A8K0CND2_IGNLU|nr:hypothetical protein ILUMI_17401 [Ignelater luminosus]